MKKVLFFSVIFCFLKIPFSHCSFAAFTWEAVASAMCFPDQLADPLGNYSHGPWPALCSERLEVRLMEELFFLSLNDHSGASVSSPGAVIYSNKYSVLIIT